MMEDRGKLRRRSDGTSRPARLIAGAAEPFDCIDGADLQPLLDRIGEARVVLLGEATHGTSEFYRMRARISRALIAHKGFTIVAVEADWPDAEHVDEYVRRRPSKPQRAAYAFGRFPSWMWRNEEVLAFVEELRGYNGGLAEERQVGFYGLDLYSLNTSIKEVIAFLEVKDPELAREAKVRYSCFTPFASDPARYGQAVLYQRYGDCEQEAVAMLTDLLEKRLPRPEGEDPLFDATQNARVVANAEQYYRVMYQGSAESWNLRDRHMFETLQALLQHRGPAAKVVVWAHNSHLGNAAATEMARRGEFNVGQLVKEAFGEASYAVGFGTHTGTVAAASNWGEEVEIKHVRPSHPRSYERLCHESGIPNFFLPLHERYADPEVRHELMDPRLERAIGVIYRPETELQSHYFSAVLPQQFDEYIWFDESEAVVPLAGSRAPELPERHPFLLGD